MKVTEKDYNVNASVSEQANVGHSTAVCTPSIYVHRITRRNSRSQFEKAEVDLSSTNLHATATADLADPIPCRMPPMQAPKAHERRPACRLSGPFSRPCRQAEQGGSSRLPANLPHPALGSNELVRSGCNIRLS